VCVSVVITHKSNFFVLTVVAAIKRVAEMSICLLSTTAGKSEARYIKAINKEIISASLVKVLMTMLVCLMCFNSVECY
jgi:hypothetical protein